MDPNVFRLFAVMVAIMVPVAIGGGVFVLLSSLARRRRGRPVLPSADEFDRLHARLDELEQRDARLEDLEERLDFIERVLPGLRESRAALDPAPKRKEATPV